VYEGHSETFEYARINLLTRVRGTEIMNYNCSGITRRQEAFASSLCSLLTDTYFHGRFSWRIART